MIDAWSTRLPESLVIPEAVSRSGTQEQHAFQPSADAGSAAAHALLFWPPREAPVRADVRRDLTFRYPFFQGNRPAAEVEIAVTLKVGTTMGSTATLSLSGFAEIYGASHSDTGTALLWGAETQTAFLGSIRWVNYVSTRLVEMLSRSYVAPAAEDYPRPDVIFRSLDVALTLFPLFIATPSVVPSDEGGVLFVWHRGGWDVEIEVDDQDVTVWAQNRADPTLRIAGRVADQRDRVIAVLTSLSTT